MKKIKNIWRNPTETFTEILSDKIKWIEIILLFAAQGFVIMYYLVRSKGLIDLTSNVKLIGIITAIILMGIIYGVISNFIFGFLIKITGNLFNATNDLKKIYSSLSWSFIPWLVGCLIIILNLVLTRIIISQEELLIMNLILSIIIIILNFGLAILGVWAVILLYKGLKIAQNLNRTNTILNYLSATVIWGITYYFLIQPYI